METSSAAWVSCKSRAPQQIEFIHESALCGDDVIFEPSPTIGNGVQIGSGVKIGAHSYFGRDLIVGANTEMGIVIQAGYEVNIGDSVCVEDFTQFYGFNIVPDRAKASTDSSGRTNVVPARDGFVYKLRDGKCIEEA